MGVIERDVMGAATFSECGRYRYTLSRIWDASNRWAMFVALNPSSADALKDDPTVRRCIRFARDWGYGSLFVGNLFAFRATEPKDLFAADEPIGHENDRWLQWMAARAGVVIAAWGVHGVYLERSELVVQRRILGDFKVLGLTKAGHPRHPLYMRAACRPLDPLTLEEAA